MHLEQEGFTIYSFLVMLGGLSVFLFGLDGMSENLKKVSGKSLKLILQNLTEHRIFGVLVGTIVTGIIQSSSATTSILVGFVQSGLMSFERTVAIIMGANIGTTVTGQIVAFKITAWALPIIAGGFMIKSFARRTKTRYIGSIIYGLGMIFLGLAIMSDAMRPLRDSPFFLNLIQNLENVPLGILVGTIFTAMVQSSSATIGIMIGMATQGLVTIEAAVPMILGANLGTCITAVLASIKASNEAKRVAAAHILFNVTGIVLFMFWIPSFIGIIKSFSPDNDIPRLIANAQTVFNIAATLMLLPFLGQIQYLAKKIIPEDKSKKVFVLPKARSLADTPDFGLLHSMIGIRHLKNIIKDMLILSRNYLINQDDLNIDKFNDLREDQKALRNDLLEYLGKLSRNRMALNQTTNILLQTEVINEIEHVAYKLEVSFERMSHQTPQFQQSIEDLEEYFKKTMKYFSKSCNAFINNSKDDATSVKAKISKLKPFEITFKQKYLKKIGEGVSDSYELDQVNLEVLEILRSINSTSTRICDIQKDGDDALLSLQV